MTINWKAWREKLLGDTTQKPPSNLKLPMLPHAVTEFTQKSSDPKYGPAELGKVIETDTGLTCDLLRYVNSSATGVRAKVNTVKHALSLLGIRPAKMFLLTAAVDHVMKSSRSKLVNFQSFWLTNLERALFARKVAELLKVDADLAFASSMIHDFLLPELTNQETDSYLEFLSRPETERTPLDVLERKKFGWDHAHAAAQVLHGWHFPDDLVCCVRLHHAGLALMNHPEFSKSSALASAIAALLSDALRQAPNGWQELQQLQTTLPNFDLATIAIQVRTEMQNLSPMANRHVSPLMKLANTAELVPA